MLTIILSLLLAAQAAYAVPDTGDARYRLLTVTDDEAGFIDERTVRKVGSTRDYWMLVVWVKPIVGRNNGKRYPFAKYHFQIDCTGWSVRGLHGVVYGENLVGEPLTTFAGEAQPIIPSSNAETVAEYLCRGKLATDLRDAPLLSESVAIEATMKVFKESSLNKPHS